MRFSKHIAIVAYVETCTMQTLSTKQWRYILVYGFFIMNKYILGTIYTLEAGKHSKGDGMCHIPSGGGCNYLYTEKKL